MTFSLLVISSSLLAAEPEFGTDLSVQIQTGGLMGPWTEPGLHSSWSGRLDAFMIPREAEGTRLGLSIFGGPSAWMRQSFQEPLEPAEGEQVRRGEVDYLHYGALFAIRSDPQLRWGSTFSLGFSRLDLSDYYEGVMGLPLFLAEAGARRLQDQGPAFLDLGLRVGWGSQAAPGEVTQWADWWLVQLQLGVGVHAR